MKYHKWTMPLFILFCFFLGVRLGWDIGYAAHEIEMEEEAGR